MTVKSEKTYSSLVRKEGLFNSKKYAINANDFV